ncbi:MAG: AEC family transporter [Neisseriaceae bacterium]|nr:AEC family transporter [Neisseriaceae bacterium]MBP6861277.1 AEC family transporter [Neisseriaceae bacterium]
MLFTVLAVLPTFFQIALGFILKRSFITDGFFWQGAERLTYYLLFPALLIMSISQADFSASNIELIILLTLSATTLIGALALASQWLFKFPLPTLSSVFQGATRFNTFMFISLSSSLLGPDGLALSGIFLAYCIIFANITSVMVLSKCCQTKKQSLLALLLTLVKNPLIVGSAIGLSLATFELSLPKVLSLFLTQIGAAATPLSLLAVGAGLTIRVNMQQLTAITWAGLLKLLALPTVMWALLSLAGLSGTAAQVALIFSALPTAGNAYILAKQMGGDDQSMASMVTWSTVSSILTIPLVLMLFNLS